MQAPLAPPGGGRELSGVPRMAARAGSLGQDMADETRGMAPVLRPIHRSPPRQTQFLVVKTQTRRKPKMIIGSHRAADPNALFIPSDRPAKGVAEVFLLCNMLMTDPSRTHPAGRRKRPRASPTASARPYSLLRRPPPHGRDRRKVEFDARPHRREIAARCR